MSRVYRLCAMHGVVDAYRDPYDHCPLCEKDWFFLCSTPEERQRYKELEREADDIEARDRLSLLKEMMALPEEMFMAMCISRQVVKGLERAEFKDMVARRIPDEPGLRPNGNDAYIAFAGTMERFIRNNITRGERNGLESGHQKRLECRNSRETEARSKAASKENVASTSC